MSDLAPVRHLFSLKEFHRMGHSGIFGEDDRVELIEGEIVEMSPIGSAHAAVVNRLNRLLTMLVGERAIVTVQNPLSIPGESAAVDSEPQPDLMLLEPRDDFYAQGHPTPEDVLLLIEVADTTLDFDRTVKLPIYSSGGIPEVWVVNLPDEVVEIYSSPGWQGYGSSRRASPGEDLEPADVPGIRVAVAEIFGR